MNEKNTLQEFVPKRYIALQDSIDKCTARLTTKVAFAAFVVVTDGSPVEILLLSCKFCKNLLCNPVVF